MKSHILFFTGSQERTGGTERVCADIASALANKNFNVEILSVFGGLKSAFPVNEKIKMSQLFTKNEKGVIFQLLVAFKLFFYIIKNKPDVVVAVESLIFINMIFLIFLPNRPKLVCWEHFNADIDLGVKMRNIARKLATIFADKIVVLTEEDKILWLKKYNIKKDKISRIYNPNPFETIEKKKKENDSNNIIAVGRLTYQKGFDILLNTWAKIPESFRLNWKLIIIGEGEDRKLLENIILKNNLSSSVNLTGHSKNINNYYENADIFILSSRFEGFGLVLLEALSYSIPIISFKCPAGPSEILNHNQNSYLVKNEDTQDLLYAIKLLINDKELREFYSKNSISSLEKFNKDEILFQWETLLKELKGNK